MYGALSLDVNPAPAAIDAASLSDGEERLPDEIDADTLRKYFTLTGPDLEDVTPLMRKHINPFGR